MGLQLLNNQSTRIEKDGQYLQLLGVENWGGGPWFPKEGDLDKCLINCAGLMILRIGMQKYYRIIKKYTLP